MVSTTDNPRLQGKLIGVAVLGGITIGNAAVKSDMRNHYPVPLMPVRCVNRSGHDARNNMQLDLVYDLNTVHAEILSVHTTW